MGNAVFLDVTPRGSCKNRRFGGTYRFSHQDDKNRELVTANFVPSSPILVTLIMEALRPFETSVLTRVTRHYISEDVIILEEMWCHCLPVRLNTSKLPNQ
jgi:hypothetical protein